MFNLNSQAKQELLKKSTKNYAVTTGAFREFALVLYGFKILISSSQWEIIVCLPLCLLRMVEINPST